MNTTNLEDVTDVNHKMYVFAPYENALALQTTTNDTRFTLYNQLTDQSLTPRFVMAASNHDLRLIKDHHTVLQFNETFVDINKGLRVHQDTYHLGNVGIGTTRPSHKLHVESSAYIRDFVGIGTTLPLHKLHVQGNVFADGTLMASNLVILGDFVQMDTVTSNTEQMVIKNDGSGPALKVTQTGMQDIMTVFDDNNLAMVVADGGNVGIGITFPQGKLHVTGPRSIIMGNLGIGITEPRGTLDVNGLMVVQGAILPATCNVYDLGSAAYRFRDIYLSGQSIDIDGVRISKDYSNDSIKISNSTGKPVDTVVGKLTSSNTIILGGQLGIGTSVAISSITVQTGDVLVLNGNIGIGTTRPRAGLHVAQSAIIDGRLGVGTSPSATHYLDVKDNARIHNTLSTQSLRLNEWSDGITLSSNVIYGPVSTPFRVELTESVSAGLQVHTKQGGQLLFVDPNLRSVGIGTTHSSSSKLDVFRASGTVVSANNATLALTHGNAGMNGYSSLLLANKENSSKYGYLQYADTDLSYIKDSSNAALTIGVAPIGQAHLVLKGNHSIFLDADKHHFLGGNVGIGTTSMREKLHVEGSEYISDSLTVKRNVAIGTLSSSLSESSKLDVYGNIIIESESFYDDNPETQFWKDKTKGIRIKSFFSMIDFSFPSFLGDTIKSRILVNPGNDVSIWTRGMPKWIKTELDENYQTIIPEGYEHDLYKRLSITSSGNVHIGPELGYYYPAINYYETAWNDTKVLSVNGSTLMRDDLDVNGITNLAKAHIGAVISSNVSVDTAFHVRGHTNIGFSNHSFDVSKDGFKFIGKTDFNNITTFIGGTFFNKGYHNLRGNIDISYADENSDTGYINFEVGLYTTSAGIRIAPMNTTFIDDPDFRDYRRFDVAANAVFRHNVIIGYLGDYEDRFDVYHKANFHSLVGIGTSSPNFDFDVYGNVGIAGTSNGISFTSEFLPAGVGLQTRTNHQIYAASDNELRIVSQRQDGFISLHTTISDDPNEKVRITGYGNVGIGTTNPIAKLHVVGDIVANSNVLSSRTITNNGVFFKTLNSGNANDEYPAVRFTANWGAVYMPIASSLTNTAPLNINSSALVGYTATGQDWGTNNMYVAGHVGIGTTTLESGAVLQVNGNANIGRGVTQGAFDTLNGGPFFKQASWSAVGNIHTIAFPSYCQGENSTGTLHIQVKSIVNNKLGNLHVSFFKPLGSSADLFVLSHHRTPNMVVLNAIADGNNVVVNTDNDCAIAWTSIGAL